MTSPASTDVAVRSQELVAWVRSDERRDQIAQALPEGVSIDRFERATATALIANPALAEADRGSLYLAILDAAQSGLFPDGRQCAIVVYNTKVKDADGNERWIKKAQCLKMIGGVRDTLAGYGWTLITSVVYAADEFAIDVAEGRVTHRQPRPGVDRGAPEGAYAQAVHRDGRRMAEMMTVAEINYVRDKAARSKNIWNDWWTRMAEKTVGHRLAKKLPLAEAERDRIARIVNEEFEPGQGAAVLYGQRRPELTEASPGGIPAEDAAPSTDTRGADATPQSAEEPSPAGGDDDPEPGLDGTDGSDEPGPALPVVDEGLQALADAAAAFNPKSTKWRGLTVGEIFQSGDEGREWVEWCCKNAKRAELVKAVTDFARVYCPEALS